MHVDEFIDSYGSPKEYTYARWFFALHRFPAVLKIDFERWINKHKLFCTYREKRYRVTGCSRLGDVWLAKDFKREIGYDLRVDVKDCMEFSDKP
jgi:hypothetical protein